MLARPDPGNSGPTRETPTTYSYDSKSTRMSDLKTVDENQQVLQHQYFYYTPVGDVEQINDEHRDVSFFYEYDSLHRLTSETNSGSYDTLVNIYDEIGNIVSKSNGSTHLSYNYNSGHAHAQSSIILNGVQYSYEYDFNGNMTAGPDFSDPFQVGRRSISYNADNRPLSISNTRARATTTTDFMYDGEGKRIKNSVQGGTTIYYVGGHYEIEGGFPVRYVFAGNLRIAKMSAEGVQYFHKDHLGSSTVVTDDTGAQLETTEYLPFGAQRTHTGTRVSSYTFTDQEWDAETGLYNYGARLYDPNTGRFVTPDIYVQSPFDPQTLNRYSYARNNPLLYVDPDGHFFHLIVAVIAPVIADVIGSAVAANIIGGAVVGAVAGGAIAAATGGDIGMGMLTGAISGAAFSFAGGIIKGSIPWFAEAANAFSPLEQAGIHAATGAATGAINASLTGGDIGIGMLTGAISAGAGKYAGVKFLQSRSVAVQFAGYSSVGAFAGGITYTMYGRDFGNGFVYGFQISAYGFWFNQQKIHKIVGSWFVDTRTDAERAAAQQAYYKSLEYRLQQAACYGLFHGMMEKAVLQPYYKFSFDIKWTIEWISTGKLDQNTPPWWPPFSPPRSSLTPGTGF